MRSARGSSSAAWGRRSRAAPARPARPSRTCSGAATRRSPSSSTAASSSSTSRRTCTSTSPAGPCPSTAESSVRSLRWSLLRELERRDAHAVREVEAVRGLAVRADARVEVELVASEALGLGLEPPEDRVGMAAHAVAAARDEVVDIERAAPREVLDEPEAGDRDGIGIVVLEGGDEAVALRALDLVDTAHEGVGIGPGRAQLEQRRRRQRG